MTGTGIEICDDYSQIGCVAFENLTMADGRVQTFTVDGIAIDDRLTTGEASAEQGGAVIEVVGAYWSVQDNNLTVVLDVHNGGDDSVHLHHPQATYQTEDRRQASSFDSYGPLEVHAGMSAGVVVFVFNQNVGGTLFVKGLSGDFMTRYEWQLPI